MHFSRVSLFFLAFLALSLTLKFGHRQERGYGDHHFIERQMVQLLKSKGYVVSAEMRPWSPIAYGQKSQCRIVMALRDPDGSTLNRIAQLAQAVGPLHYAYRGSISDAPPVLDPLIRGRIVRQIRQFGIHAELSPVLAIAASTQCNLSEFDWSRLASTP